MKRLLVMLFVLVTVVPVFSIRAVAARETRTPEQFFGFKIGTDGELARYPKVLEILRPADVEIDRATRGFQAGGREFPAGSWVVKTAQPFGAFAKTMLEKQVYPDLRHFPGGPPIAPYDVTGHTLGMLMGVDVQQIEERFEAALERVNAVAPSSSPMPPTPRWAYVFGPESNAGFVALARLQQRSVPVYRAAASFMSAGKTFIPGTWIVPSGEAAARVLQEVTRDTGLAVTAVDEPVAVDGFRLKQPTRIGLWKAAGNAPAGWLMWLFERYGFSHRVISSQEVGPGLATRYDVIVLPAGTTRERIVQGLNPRQHDETWRWAYGVGDAGRAALRDWVRNGGTLVAIGDAVETARELLDLPIEAALPESKRDRTYAGVVRDEHATGAAVDDAVLKRAFQSPSWLYSTLRDRVVEPETLFYCPGSLLANQFDVTHPVAFGMPAEWPVFFESDQAYRLTPGFGARAEVVARYPEQGSVLTSGWLLGDEYLRGQANVIAFRAGRGTVVTLASQIDFRAQPRATFKLLFNAIYQGPAMPIAAADLKRLSGGSPTDGRNLGDVK